MKKYLQLFALALVTTLSFTACNSSQTSENQSGNEKKIIVGATMLSMQNEFVVNVHDKMEKKAEQLGVELIVNDAQRSALKQVEQVESFIAQKVDVIVLNPCEVEASSPAVQKALAANIPIVNVNSATSAIPTAFVGSDDREAGRMAIRFIAEKLGGKGNIIMIHGYIGQAAQIHREQGAKEVLKEFPELKLIAEQSGEWDRAKSMSLMENWIQSYGKEINAVFAHNDEMAMGALKALEEAGLKNQVILISIDAIEDALQAVKEGRLDATIFQNADQQGAKAIETAVKIVKGEHYEKQLLIPFELVTQQNVAGYIK